MARDRTYAQLGEFKLVSFIAEGDGTALEELLNYRRFFCHHERNSMRLSEVIEQLRRELADAGGSREADMAYDRTVDKFSKIPTATSRQKVDCRKYYQAVVYKVYSLAGTQENNKDQCVRDLLNRFVHRHFWLSVKECRRSLDFTRYNWGVGPSSISVLMPRSLAGKERENWLNSHIPTEIAEAGSRDSIQAIINEHFPNLHASLESADKAEFRQTDFRDSLDDMVSSNGLAKAVAHEKADRLAEQRPSIRALGEDKLRRLILTVFQQLDEENYDEGRISLEFQISKSTYSRFAGSRWKKSREGTIPDLWRNVAGVLANNERFREACKAAHVWFKVKTIASSAKP